ncbi:MAG TPA: ATP-binding cassette domain-containing protein [Thermoleophilia bacterium]|nr:ATP-binding cassette domain-containing protein [Thermoleophilia bacterium]
MRLAELSHVTYTYPGREDPSLRDVSLTLEPAEVVLVLGDSGSGKSTLLRALAGLVPHFHGGTFAGRVVVAGRDTRDARPRDLAGDVGLVFQDPESQAVMTTVEREIAFGLENLGVPPRAVTRLVEEALISLGLSNLRHAELATLSGGELQKVALAAVIAAQPHLLLLDEPTSQLDPVSSEELLAAVRRLSEDTGASIVLAEHRVERCLHLATRVLYLEDGVVVRDDHPDAFAAWAAGRRRELLPPVTRLFAQTMNGHGPLGGRLPMTVKDARRLLEESAAGGELQLGFAEAPASDAPPAGRTPAAAAPEAGTPAQVAGAHPVTQSPGEALLRVRDLAAGYHPDEPVLEGIDLELRRGEVVALMGENGAGKTTLVKHFNGLFRPSRGRVLLLGRDVRDLTVAEAARSCALLGQNPNDYFVKDTVAEELAYSLDALGVGASEEREALLARAIGSFDLEPLMAGNPRDLSGGERTRVALAAVAVGDPALLVLDEPTRGMDPGHKADLGRRLRRLADDGRGVLVVTHDVEFVARFATRVVILGDGRVLADGPAAEVLDGSLFFSTQLNRLLRHALPGALHEDQLRWRAS